MGQEPGTANSGTPAPVPTRRTPRSLDPRAEPHLQALQRGVRPMIRKEEANGRGGEASSWVP